MSTSTSMSARGHHDRIDAALAVRRRRTDAGPGQLNLPGRVRRTRRAHVERPGVDRLEVGHRVQAERGQDLDLLGPAGDDLRQRGRRRPARRLRREPLDVDLGPDELGRPPVQPGEIVQGADPVRLVQAPAAGADTCNQAQVGDLLEPVAAPLPPAAHVALLADDRLGQQRRGRVVQVVLGRVQDPEPVGELELVARHGTHAPGRDRRRRTRADGRLASARSCQTITPSVPQTPAAKHSGEPMPAASSRAR